MHTRFAFGLRCLVVFAMVLSVVAAWAVARTPSALAGPTASGKNDNDEDHDNNGQVLEIHKDTNPQEIIMANGDGRVTVKLLKSNLLQSSGVKPGDHIRVTGEKVHELLFEATELDIRVRCCGEPRSDNDDPSDNNDDKDNPEEDNENR